MLAGTYRRKHSAEYRRSESEDIRHLHPDRIPIIAEVHPTSHDALLGDRDVAVRYKYLVPDEMNVANFLIVLRRRMQVPSDQALYLFVTDAAGSTSRLITGGQMLSAVYERHKSVEDGYLYVVYATESTFG